MSPSNRTSTRERHSRTLFAAIRIEEQNYEAVTGETGIPLLPASKDRSKVDAGSSPHAPMKSIIITNKGNQAIPVAAWERLLAPHRRKRWLAAV